MVFLWLSHVSQLSKELSSIQHMPPPTPCPGISTAPVKNHLTPELQQAMEKWLSDRIKVVNVAVFFFSVRYLWVSLHLCVVLTSCLWIRSRMQSGWLTKESAQTVSVPWQIKWLTLLWRLKVRNIRINIYLGLQLMHFNLHVHCCSYGHQTTISFQHNF